MSELNQKVKSKSRVGLGQSKVVFTLISILLGLLVGALVLAISGYNPLAAYQALIEGVIKSPRNMGWAIVTSTPIILTGLGVCFAFKTGLFNMGAEGQFIVGTIVGLVVGYALPLPPIIHPIVSIILAMIAGALYGALAGFIKAKFGIHEVISTIMLNWIAFYFQNYITNTFKKPNSMASYEVLDSAKITFFVKAPDNMGEFFNNFFRAPVHAGTILAIVAVIIVWYILNKTVLGYQLKAVGLNREASEYGGINSGNKIIQSMAISGSICALAGVTQILGFTYALSVLSGMENYGFDGLAVSLLASNHPVGVIFSGLFFGSLKYAGSNLQRVLGVPTELINVIIGTIILFTAVPLVFRIIRAHRRQKKSNKEAELISVDEDAVAVPLKEEKEVKVAETKEVVESENNTEAIKLSEDKEPIKTTDDDHPRVINETGEEIIVRTIKKEEE